MASSFLAGRLFLFGVDVVVDLGEVIYRRLVGGGVANRRLIGGGVVECARRRNRVVPCVYIG